MTELTVSVSTEDGAGAARTVVRLVGEADATTGELTQVLDAEVAKRPRLLLVDMSGLTFADSAALHEILRAHRKLRADGCQLALISPGGAVARILQLSAIDQVIPVYASAEEAAAGTGSPARPPRGHWPLSRRGPGWRARLGGRWAVARHR